MEATRIENTLITKLTAKEANALGLFNIGVMLYKGTLKSRKQGWKTVKVNDFQTDFVGEHTTLEFIKMVSSGSDDAYAMRVRRDGEYVTSIMPLWGVDFFK